MSPKARGSSSRNKAWRFWTVVFAACAAFAGVVGFLGDSLGVWDRLFGSGVAAAGSGGSQSQTETFLRIGTLVDGGSCEGRALASGDLTFGVAGTSRGLRMQALKLMAYVRPNSVNAGLWIRQDSSSRPSWATGDDWQGQVQVGLDADGKAPPTDVAVIAITEAHFEELRAGPIAVATLPEVVASRRAEVRGLSVVRK